MLRFKNKLKEENLLIVELQFIRDLILVFGTINWKSWKYFYKKLVLNEWMNCVLYISWSQCWAGIYFLPLVVKDGREVRLFTGPQSRFCSVSALQQVGQHQVGPLLVAMVVVDLDGRREMRTVVVVADRGWVFGLVGDLLVCSRFLFRADDGLLIFVLEVERVDVE